MNDQSKLGVFPLLDAATKLRDYMDRNDVQVRQGIPDDLWDPFTDSLDAITRGNTRNAIFRVEESDVRMVLRGFEEGVFIRDVAHDHESAWAAKLVPYLAALGRLQRAVDQTPPNAFPVSKEPKP